MADTCAGPQRLDCGALLAALLEQIDQGRLEPTDPHQAGCRWCLAALRDAASTGSALELVRADGASMPVGLVDRVLAAVHPVRGPRPALELAAAGRLVVAGDIRVDLGVIAAIARTAGTTVPGARVVRCSVVASGRGGALVVRLGLLVDGRTPLPLLAVAVRQAVHRAVRQAIGPAQVQVELAASDLFD